jgi:hypothetical protein
MMRLVARGPVALEQAFGASLQSVRAYSNGVRVSVYSCTLRSCSQFWV